MQCKFKGQSSRKLQYSLAMSASGVQLVEEKKARQRLICNHSALSLIDCLHHRFNILNQPTLVCQTLTNTHIDKHWHRQFKAYGTTKHATPKQNTLQLNYNESFISLVRMFRTVLSLSVCIRSAISSCILYPITLCVCIALFLLRFSSNEN